MKKTSIDFLLSAALLSILIGCTPKVRSFFFDGVPLTVDSVQLVDHDTEKHPDTVRSAEIAALAGKPGIYYHPPYQNKKCKVCHDPSSAGKLLQEQKELCNNCYDDFSTEYRFVHGPVGGGQCTSCHSPHQSENVKLLLRTGQELCLFCHDTKNVSMNASHNNTGDADCQECHNPHGSDKEYFLK